MEKKFAEIINEGKKNGKKLSEINEEPKDAQRTVDMRRRPELAGTKQIQWIPGGKFEVTYDEDGYAKSAVRVND